MNDSRHSIIVKALIDLGVDRLDAEVAYLVWEGKTNKEVGEHFGLDHEYISVFMRRVYKVLKIEKHLYSRQRRQKFREMFRDQV